MKLEAAIREYGYNTIVMAGGVAANSHLRAEVEKMCKKNGARLCMPSKSLCGDNGAMIGAQCYFEYLSGVRADTDLNAFATGSASF